MDRVDIENNIRRIKEHYKGHILPNVYVVHGELTPEEMNSLYTHPKVKAHISLTKGEGFGRPLLEAASSGKPVIASGWSGHLDFLRPENSILVDGKLENVHPSAQVPGMINTQMQWFMVDYQKAGMTMLTCFEDYKKANEFCKNLKGHISRNFTLDKMTQKLGEIVDRHVKVAIPLKLDNPHAIKLPKLTPIKKVGDVKLPKFELKK